MPETTNGSLAPICLHSDRLSVEIAPPGTAYQGTRFDWTAFITQVTLDDQHTFCVPESYEAGQGTGGVGLCNEFGIDMPVGYDDARPGDCFPKLGIGLLVRPDEAPYRFARPYEIAERYGVQIETTADRTHFAIEPLDCRGYAAYLEKTVTAQGSHLEIAYRLSNTGSQRLRTVEYCHNFCGIDGHSIGPDYRLSVPYAIQLEPLPPAMLRQALPDLLAKIAPDWLLKRLISGTIRRRSNVLVVNGNELTLSAVPERPFYQRLLGFSVTSQPQWELIHTPSGVGVREVDDFVPARVAVWGTSHVISTEIFVAIDLLPGETQTWSRRYEFFSQAQ
jgi:hypothetical protein